MNVGDDAARGKIESVMPYGLVPSRAGLSAVTGNAPVADLLRVAIAIALLDPRVCVPLEMSACERHVENHLTE